MGWLGFEMGHRVHVHMELLLYPMIWKQYVEDAFQRTERNARRNVLRDNGNPDDPEVQLMVLTAIREGLVKAFTDPAGVDVTPMLTDLDEIFDLLRIKDPQKNVFFNILAVENIQRTMEGVPLIRPARKTTTSYGIPSPQQSCVPFESCERVDDFYCLKQDHKGIHHVGIFGRVSGEPTFQHVAFSTLRSRGMKTGEWFW